jgi:hypothetical protein
MGARTLSRIELEAIHVTFWQGICLHFVCVLSLSVRMNLNVTDCSKPTLFTDLLCIVLTKNSQKHDK